MDLTRIAAQNRSFPDPSIRRNTSRVSLSVVKVRQIDVRETNDFAARSDTHLSVRAMQTTRPTVNTRWLPIGEFISALIASAALLQSSSDANPSICWVVGLVGLP
jgi:hypothetical protein